MGTNAKGNTNVKNESPYKSVESFLSGETTLKSAAQYDFKYEMNPTVYTPICQVYVKENILGEKDSIRRFINYKVAELAFDCDGSGNVGVQYLCGLSREIYQVLWNWEGIQNGKIERYSECVLSEKDIKVGPDTMHSFVTTFNCIECKKEEHILKLFEKFAITTNCIGNFVLVPAYFNPYRNSKVKDYWDLSLLLLKNKNKEKEWIWGKGNKIEWSANLFNRYINIFFLWDYVVPCNVEKQYAVKSLFADKFWKENYCGEQFEDSHSKYIRTNGKEGSVMPQINNASNNEIKRFLKNVNETIRRRGIFMVAMLLLKGLKSNEKDLYDILQEEIFCKDNVYTGYQEIFNNIRKELKLGIYDENVDVSNNITSNTDVKTIIDIAEKLICHSQMESSRK